MAGILALRNTLAFWLFWRLLDHSKAEGVGSGLVPLVVFFFSRSWLQAGARNNSQNICLKATENHPLVEPVFNKWWPLFRDFK